MQRGEMGHRDTETGWNDGLPNRHEDADFGVDCKQSLVTVLGNR